MDKNLGRLADSVEGYLQNLYWMNYRFRIVSHQMLERGDLSGVKLLILPSAVYMTQDEAKQLDAWVRSGGIALCEAHLATYDATRGRHARQMPGHGLATAWGIRETESTAAEHLRLERGGSLDGYVNPDELKAWSGAIGTEFVPIRLNSGTTAWGGGSRYAVLRASDAESVGSFDGANPTILFKRIGKGGVIYCGANLGQGAKRDASGLREVLNLAAQRAGVARTLTGVDTESDVHVDVLESDGQARYVLIWNRADGERTVSIQLPGNLRGLFTGKTYSARDGGSPATVPPRFIDLFEVAR
jgi:hypothetical protein